MNLFVGMTFPFSEFISSISASPISSFFWNSKRWIEYTVSYGMLSRAFPGFQRYDAAKAGSLQESRPAKEEDRRKSRSCDDERRAQLSTLLECSNLANFRLPHVSASSPISWPEKKNCKRRVQFKLTPPSKVNKSSLGFRYKSLKKRSKNARSFPSKIVNFDLWREASLRDL